VTGAHSRRRKMARRLAAAISTTWLVASFPLAAADTPPKASAAADAPPKASAQKAGPIAPNTPLPAGHPPMNAPPDDGDGDGAGAPASPHGPHGPGAEGPQVQDRVMRAPELRPGTLEVHLHDSSEQPLPNFPIRLGIQKQDVAEGDSRAQRDATTDDKGVVVFTGLDVGSAFSYRVTAAQGPATFASEPVRLEPTAGHKVLLHVFPVTRDLNQALIGARGIVFVAPREDVFQVEVSFRILNIGKQAWVPENITLSLPDGAKAFRASDSMQDTRMEKMASGELQLLGTYSPGENDVNFQFQLENDHAKSKRFRIELLPHVAEVRVIAERARGMALEVDGFPEAETVQGRDGSRLLLTAKQLVRGDAPLSSVSVQLDNLPVPSTGRWYALGIAAVIAFGGLFEAGRRRREPQVRALPVAERKEAERLLLDELVTLEKLRQKELIGPRTYEENRAELLNALARLTPGDVETKTA
jgi:hypothetical protein